MDEMCQEAELAIQLAAKEEERERLTHETSSLYMKLAAMSEGAWTGSHGGHDPDALKMKGNLLKWWKEKARKDPHPFAYCVRHLRKRFPKPERICAWLKDQALGTTKWRNQQEGDIEPWEPTVEELRDVMECLLEAEASAHATDVDEADVIRFHADGSKTFE